MKMTTAEYLKSVYSLEGKNILMTGGTGGLGSRMAVGMAQAGAKMIVCDILPERLDKLAAEIKDNGGDVATYTMDVTNREEIDNVVTQIIKDHEKVDVLFNVAGINKREGILDVTEQTWDKMMGVNLKGLYFVSQRVGLEMYKRRSGNIINMASHTTQAGVAGCSVYGATKAAVKALTQVMAIEWAQYGIRCNAIAPGHFRTELTEPTWIHPVRSKYLCERIAMERPGKAEELVGLAILLASDASSYMTGQVYHVDGGCLAGGAPWPYDTKFESKY